MSQLRRIQAVVDEFLESEWVRAMREEGRAIYLITSSARVAHADPLFYEMIERKKLPQNGFDMSHPQDAAAGGVLMSILMHQDYEAWWAFLGDDGKRKWLHIKGIQHPTLMTFAVKRETNPDLCYPHGYILGPDGSRSEEYTSQ